MVETKTISQIIESVSPYYKKKKEPEAQHTLVYDSSSETIEPLYFYIIDLMNEQDLAPQKLVDNFSSAVGGSHFSEVGMKASRMQEEAMKIMGSVNTVLRSILNIVYDLRDFRMRLKHYDDSKSSKKEEKEAALLALKQIWMDKVDFIARGNSSIKAMALGQAGYQTLIDAFLISKDAEDVDKLDLNDRVKRILKPRVQEFNIWLSESEKELRKRYDIQRSYLKSQVASLKLYSRWVKPYLKAAQNLEMKDFGRDPGIVNAFNTMILELVLLGKNKLDVKKSALSGDFPLDFQKLKTKRDYYSCILVEFRFRAIPRQGVFVGKSDITFKAYSLNSDELKKFEKELELSDVSDMLKLVEGATTESLDLIKEDIDFFLNEKPEKEEKKESSNPFLALFGFYEKKGKDETGAAKEEKLKEDDWVEKNYFRKLTAAKAKETCFLLFDVYKKAHGMPSTS
ncbi:MAG: hypothetical protein Q7R52_01015 [archaeon]|nr:hypothetical protein [archaeon]